MKRTSAILVAVSLLTAGHSMADIGISPIFTDVGSISSSSGNQYVQENVSEIQSWNSADTAFVGYNNMGIMWVDGGSTFSGAPSVLVLGENAGANGIMNVMGAGSTYEVFNSAVTVGGMFGTGTGSLGASTGGYIRSATFSVGLKGTGYVTIQDSGSRINALQSTIGGANGGLGEVVIKDGGLFVPGSLTMNAAGGAGTSSINLEEGGMLELSGTYADLGSFMGSIDGTAAINFKSGGEYVDITTGTEGVDYTLTQNGGTTTLEQIPEPSSIVLISLVGAGVIFIRRTFMI